MGFCLRGILAEVAGTIGQTFPIESTKYVLRIEISNMKINASPAALSAVNFASIAASSFLIIFIIYRVATATFLKSSTAIHALFVQLICIACQICVYFQTVVDVQNVNESAAALNDFAGDTTSTSIFPGQEHAESRLRNIFLYMLIFGMVLIDSNISQRVVTEEMTSEDYLVPRMLSISLSTMYTALSILSAICIVVPGLDLLLFLFGASTSTLFTIGCCYMITACILATMSNVLQKIASIHTLDFIATRKRVNNLRTVEPGSRGYIAIQQLLRKVIVLQISCILSIILQIYVAAAFIANWSLNSNDSVSAYQTGICLFNVTVGIIGFHSTLQYPLQYLFFKHILNESGELDELGGRNSDVVKKVVFANEQGVRALKTDIKMQEIGAAFNLKPQYFRESSRPSKSIHGIAVLDVPVHFDQGYDPSGKAEVDSAIFSNRAERQLAFYKDKTNRVEAPQTASINVAIPPRSPKSRRISWHGSPSNSQGPTPSFPALAPPAIIITEPEGTEENSNVRIPSRKRHSMGPSISFH